MYHESKSLSVLQDPEALYEKQKQDWQPIIDWFCQRHSVEIQPSTSINSPTFSSNAREQIRRHLLSYNMNAIQGFTFGVDAIKSILLMSAIVDKRLTVNEAVDLSRLETKFQTEKWGNVEWHHDLELHDTSARVAAAALFVQCHTSEHLIQTKNVNQ